MENREFRNLRHFARLLAAEIENRAPFVPTRLQVALFCCANVTVDELDDRHGFAIERLVLVGG